MQCDIFLSNMAFCIFPTQKTGIYAIIQRKTLINLHFSKILFNSIVKNIYPNISSGIFRQTDINKKTLITLSKFSIFFESRYSFIFLLQNSFNNYMEYNYYKSRFSVYFYLRNTIFIKNQE